MNECKKKAIANKRVQKRESGGEDGRCNLDVLRERRLAGSGSCRAIFEIKQG